MFGSILNFRCDFVAFHDVKSHSTAEFYNPQRYMTLRELCDDDFVGLPSIAKTCVVVVVVVAKSRLRLAPLVVSWPRLGVINCYK